MSDAVFGEILKVSIYGPLLIAMGWAVVKLWRKDSQTQELRVQDAQKYASAMGQVTQRMVEVVAANNEFLKGNKEGSESVAEALRDVLEYQRRRDR
jgi:hypothetical protein